MTARRAKFQRQGCPLECGPAPLHTPGIAATLRTGALSLVGVCVYMHVYMCVRLCVYMCVHTGIWLPLAALASCQEEEGTSLGAVP
jgi:hypothetical protein